MFRLNKLIEYTLYLFVFLLPFQTRFFIEKGSINGGYSEYGTIGLYIFDIVLVALLSLFLIQQSKKIKMVDSPPKISFLWWLIAGLDLTIFISIFVAEDHVLSIYRYAVFLFGAGLFWVLAKAEYSRLKMYLALLSGIFIHAGLGIWQFLTQSDFACKWLGMAGHSASAGGTSVVEVAEAGERWLRAYGGLPHPNILGGVLAIGTLIILGILINYESRIKNYELKRKSSYLLPLISYLLILVFTAALFFTFSRGAWLSLAVGLLVLSVANYWKKNKSASLVISRSILIMFLLLAILSVFYSGIINTRLTGGTELEEKSATERMVSMSDAREMIKEHPVLGVGVGNYSLELAEQDPGGSAWSYQPVHNTFLLVWAEIGFMGLMFFVSVLAWVAAVLYKRGDHWGLAVLASLMVILTFEHWLWSLHSGVLFFWLVLGVIYTRSTKSQFASRRNKFQINFKL